MFGDGSERYLEAFEKILEDTDIEDFLEQEDLSLADALYLLFFNGHIRSPLREEEALPTEEGT